MSEFEETYNTPLEILNHRKEFLLNQITRKDEEILYAENSKADAIRRKQNAKIALLDVENAIRLLGGQ